MSGRSKEIRDEIIDSGSPLRNHSLNQRWMSLLLGGEVRLFGNPNNKARKAEERRIKHKQFLRDLPRYQLERSLRKLIEGKGSDEDEAYVLGHISTYYEFRSCHCEERSDVAISTFPKERKALLI